MNQFKPVFAAEPRALNKTLNDGRYDPWSPNVMYTLKKSGQAKIEYILHILGIFGLVWSGFGHYTFENLLQNIQNPNDYAIFEMF